MIICDNEKSEEMVKKYPWLAMASMYYGDKNLYNAYDDIPEGWRIAFGDKMIEKIDKEIKSNHLENYSVNQVKEKFGELRWYHHGFNKEIDDIVNAYSVLSRNICISCGKPDVPYTKTGWIYPMCRACATQTLKYGYSLPYDEMFDVENSAMEEKIKYTKYSNHESIEVEINISEIADEIRADYIGREMNDN